jgi:hypothetical protein
MVLRRRRRKIWTWSRGVVLLRVKALRLTYSNYILSYMCGSKDEIAAL